MKKTIKGALKHFGWQLSRVQPQAEYPPDVSPEERQVITMARPFTMTSVERLIALVHAVKHLVQTGCPGSFLECGVWKGGSMMAIAETLLSLGVRDRDLYLFDTFEGLPAPSDLDCRFDGESARDKSALLASQNEKWCYASLEEVKENLKRTSYPPERIHFIKGKVEETIPEQLAPGPIALLRLDTDWYASTRHELEHLFPQLSPGGILIIDDYGHWQGARQAVDEFLAREKRPAFLHRVDYSARLLVKP